MKRVGSRELKNRWGTYMKRVRRGERLIVTDRGEPVAQLSPPDPEPPVQKTLEETHRELAAQGLLRLATGKMGPFKPIPARGGKSASEMIIEDRR